MKMLETVANMLIVSFFCLLFSIPIVTIVPAFAAGYHTMVKVVFGPKKGHGVFRDFFDSYKQNLWPGVKLNLIIMVAVFFLFVGDYAGWQIYKKSAFGAAYFALGILFTITFTSAVVYVPPVLSRFEGTTMTFIRLSLFFASQHLFRSLFYAFLLAALIWMIDFFPLVILILPALYLDLIRPGMEKAMSKFIEDSGLTDVTEEEAEETEEEEEEVSSADLEKNLAKNRKRNNGRRKK